MAILKNIKTEEVLKIADEIQIKEGQVISKTLVQNKGVGITLFAFSKGEGISTHDSTGDAFVHVIEGTGKFTVGGVDHIVHAGEVLVMPAKIPHAVYAEDNFKMVLTVVFPEFIKLD